MMDGVERIPRMRTAAKIVEEVKRIDPETDLTESCVRRLAKQGAFPVVWAGSKALINLDDVLELLRLGTARSVENAVPTVGGIRRIDPKRTR